VTAEVYTNGAAECVKVYIKSAAECVDVPECTD